MRGLGLLGTMVLVVAPVLGPSGCAQQAPARPQLIVLVVVDQLRSDMLDTFGPAFDGGFRRFRDAGIRFTSASHAHAITETAAGHATISTGVFPARHGIVANEWQQRAGVRWNRMYSVEDGESAIVGADWAPGRSPKNLLRTGLADWVQAADSDARVVSISGKDRAAITLAGQAKGEVYWLLHETGTFVTSEYYRGAYPRWVSSFNQGVMPGIMADTVWDTTVPSELRWLARDDSTEYEGDGVHTAFPHLASAEVAANDQVAFNVWVSEQPRADRAVLELARVAVEELDLGGRGSVDFLAISLSATDYVGHAFGPMSLEQLDNLMRADRELGEFLEFLDERVGSGGWVAALTADHGVMTAPEYLQETGVDPNAVRSPPGSKRRAISEALVEASRGGGSPPEIADRVARTIEERGGVAKAYTHFELTRGEPADSFAILFRNSHYPGRAHSSLSPYGVEIRYAYDEIVRAPTGTTHGSPYWYDRHVPFILLAPGITPGTSAEAVYTVDVAPTLAALTGIDIPYDLDGRAVNR